MVGTDRAMGPEGKRQKNGSAVMGQDLHETVLSPCLLIPVAFHQVKEVPGRASNQEKAPKPGRSDWPVQRGLLSVLWRAEI